MNTFVTLLLLLLQPTQPVVPAWQTDPNVPIPYVGVPPGYVSRTPIQVVVIQQPQEAPLPQYYQQSGYSTPQVVYTPQPQQSYQSYQGPILTGDGSMIYGVMRPRSTCQGVNRTITHRGVASCHNNSRGGNR